MANPKQKGRAKCIPPNPEAIFLPYQERWVRDRARLKLMEKSRQIGLSWSTAYPTVERTAAESARYDQWVSSRDEIQARLFLEDCRMWARMYQMAAGEIGETVIDPEKKFTALVLPFASGKKIYSMSSNPDAQAGKRGGRVLDEYALHKDQRTLWTITYPGLTWGGQLEVISTHRGSRSHFNELVTEAREKGNPKNISLHRVTLQDALDQGFLYKLQQALPADAEQQAMDEAEYFDFIKGGAADEESFFQEYMCVPGDDDAAFLEYDLIASCEYGAMEHWEIDLIQARMGEPRRLFGGLDIGRQKDLTVLWVMELLGDVLYTRAIITLQKMSKPDQEAILWPWIACLERCAIDYTGLGIGWGDDALAEFGEHHIDLVTFTAQAKERLAYPVRGAMEERRVRIPFDPIIRADLRGVTKSTTAAGNVRFTAERTANGHADRFWSLALAIEAATSPGIDIDFTAAGGGTWKGGQPDFDEDDLGDLASDGFGEGVW